MINLTKEELQDIASFIDRSLDNDWDRYTDIYIVTGTTWEDGKKRMNPEMYALMQKINDAIYD